MLRVGLCMLLLVACCAADKWYNCPLYTHGVPSHVKETVPDGVQCALFSQLLNYADPNLGKIHIFVKKLSTSKSPKKALWLLPGGPGRSSTYLEQVVHQLYNVLGSEFDFYITDHRGTGRSSRMSCIPAQAETIGSEEGVHVSLNEFIECSKTIDATFATHMTVMNAAQDVLSIMQHLAATGITEQYIYGLSYGTLWTTRIMQNSDNLVSGVILDGIVATMGPARTTFDHLDVTTENAGHQLIQKYCTDIQCKHRLGDNPSHFAQKTFTSLFDGSNDCIKRLSMQQEGFSTPPVNLTASHLRLILAEILDHFEERQLIPAVLHRLARCHQSVDVPVLQHFIRAVHEYIVPNLTCEPLSSVLLQTTIALSEMWSIPAPSYHDLEQIYNKTVFSYGVYVLAKIREQSQWPIYIPSDTYFNKSFTTSKPVLLLNGGLDPRTPLLYAHAQLESIVQTTGNKELIVVKEAPHFVVANSPVADSNINCGLQILVKFLKNPRATGSIGKDMDCLHHSKGINFDGNEALNYKYFRTRDIYEGEYMQMSNPKAVSMYLFLGIELTTVVVALTVITLLVYYIVEVKSKRFYNNN